MSGVFTDLVSGRRVEASDAPLVPGQWALLDEVGAVVCNGFMAAHGDRLVGRKNGSWSVARGVTPVSSGSFDLGLDPADVDADALRAMNEVFESHLSKHAAWSQWCGLSPLAPRLSEHLREKPFDQSIAEHLEFLEAVCGSPRSYVRVEEDMVPTARARKLARKAITRLASHREDWERPTVLGIRPRRVLCVVPDTDFDLYENRVAAQLVEHLRGYLLGRLDQLARIRRMLTQITDHAAGAARGHHWRRDRLYTLWSQAVADDAAADAADRMTERLEALLVRVLRLVDSPLYKAVPRGVAISGLRFTNIFANDPVYRRVAVLWKKWREDGVRRPVSESSVYESLQQVACGISWFTLLLVARAADQLHLKPVPGTEAAPVDDAELVLEGPTGRCSVLPPRDGAVILRVGSKCIRVVGLAASLRGEDPSSATVRLRALEDAARKAREDFVLVLHLTPERAGDADSELRSVLERLSTAGPWEPSVHPDSRLALMPVSPWDIGSVERIARFLRWHLHGGVLEAYPPRVRCSLPSNVSHAKWIVQGPERDSWLVVRGPKPKELSVDDLAASALQESEARAAAAGGKAARYAGREADKHGRQIREELRRALAAIRQLEVCPVCWDGRGTLTPLDTRTRSFRATCPSCDSAWGVYACGCGNSFPFIEPRSIERALGQDRSRGPGWVDLLLGADVLAVPCVRSLGKPSFVCPRCRTCACAQHEPVMADQLGKPMSRQQ